MEHCEECGVARQYLHRHHIVPRYKGGGDEPENIKRLCANCHEDVHGGPFGGTIGPRASASPEARRKKSVSGKAAWAAGRYANRKPRSPEAEARRAAAAVAARRALDPEKEAIRARRSADARRATAAKRNAKRNAQIRDLRDAELPLTAIAALVGCCPATVSHVLRQQRDGLIP